LTNDSEIGRPLNNLINRMPEFERFTAKRAERWTLPMAAAWFIWRDFAAVDDQWKIVMGEWAPAFDPPTYILSHDRRQPGTLTCVFQEAGYACGRRPYVRLQDIRDLPSLETTDPYDRLRVALQTGRLRATIVQDSTDEGGQTESGWGKDDWLDFDSLADPARNAPYHAWSDPANFAVLVSREDAIRVEGELSRAEAERPIWKLEQTLGWIAYRKDQTFRSLGRIDLKPPTFFGRSYKSDRVENQPLGTLTSALLSGEVNAYVQGIAMTRAECISLLSDKDGLWGKKDLDFVPDEIRVTWQRRAERKEIAGSAKRQALEQLIGILQQAKAQDIRALRKDAEDWAERRYGISGKAFLSIWLSARKGPHVARDLGGQPSAAQKEASASLFKPYLSNPTQNPNQ
jgi:hypothetical protein